jgi:hypothetical protein
MGSLIQLRVASLAERRGPVLELAAGGGVVFAFAFAFVFILLADLGLRLCSVRLTPPISGNLRECAATDTGMFFFFCQIFFLKKCTQIAINFFQS